MYGIVYCFTNKTDGKEYIGQTTRKLEDRVKDHLETSSKTKRYFQHALKKYGVNAFTVSVLGRAGNKKRLDKLEVYWINKKNTLSPNGYNLMRGGNLGGKHSEESKKRMSESAKLRPHLPHTKKTKSKMSKTRKKFLDNNPQIIAKMRLSGFKRTSSKEARKKLSDRAKAQWNNTDLREKVLASLVGKVRSKQHCLRLSLARRGTTSSPQTRAKVSASLLGNTRRRGKPQTPEARAKMSISQTGRKHKPETILKMKAAWKKRKGEVISPSQFTP